MSSNNEDDDEDVVTPRESGSLPRWPIHAGRCESAALQLDKVAYHNLAQALRKRKVTFEIDIKGARTCEENAQRCRELANKFRNLAQIFTSWERVDPGIEKRLEVIGEMYDTARFAKTWGVKL